jgi:hypothetical protein
MTTHFYRMMIVIVATLMSLIGCNKESSSETDTGYDTADAEAVPYDDWDSTIYGDPYTPYDTEAPYTEADVDEDNYYPDTVYGDPGVDFDDSVDNDTNVDEDADEDEYDALLYGDPYTEYDADLANDDDEIIGTDENK